MKSLIISLLVLFISNTSFAQISERMRCELGDGSCIGDSCYQDIRISESELQFTLQPIFLEILAAPTTAYSERGFDKYKLTNRSFVASWDGAEHWLSMKSKNGYEYFGTITLDQDFEMEISCIRDSVFFE